MFIALTVFCVVLALVVVPAERQRRAVAALLAIDGEIDNEDVTARFRAVDYFFGVEILYDYEVPDGAWEGIPMAGISPPRPAWLRELIGVDYFADVKEVLCLHSQIRDDDLRHLRCFSKLEILMLNFCDNITDAGLVHLKSLDNLREVWIGGTNVTASGVEDLQRALPNCKIYSNF